MLATYFCVVNVIEAQTANVVALLRCNRRQQLLHRHDLVCIDLTVEYGAVDQERFDGVTLEAICTNVACGVHQLAEVAVVVFFSYEADDVRR